MAVSFSSFSHKILDFLVPPGCLSCHSPVSSQGTLCPPCWEKMVFISSPYCSQCGAPFIAGGHGTFVCGACLEDPPFYEAARAPLVYTKESRSLILSLKHGDGTHLARWLGQWMSHSVFDIIENIDIILPVPLHPSRLRHRHYNQAALLGKYVGENWGRPFQVDVLKRHRPTPPQGHLTQGRRWKNVQGAFHVPSHRASLIKGARILLVDDVFTTGATLHACARALRQGGAQNVSISVACRVLPT